MKYDYLIVGSGLFGAIFANEAKKRGKRAFFCLTFHKVIFSFVRTSLNSGPSGGSISRYTAYFMDSTVSISISGCSRIIATISTKPPIRSNTVVLIRIVNTTPFPLAGR